MAFYVLLASAILVACCGYIFSFFEERPKLPDGPRRLAFLGNVFTLSRMHSSPDRELLQIAQRWGDICMLWCGLTPAIVVNSPKAAYELMTNVPLSAPCCSCPSAHACCRGAVSTRLVLSTMTSGAACGHGD